MYKELYFDKI